MSERTFPVDHTQHNEIIAALRRAFEKVKHHEKFTKRIKPIVQAELPKYTIYVGTEGSFSRVEVWGNGISHVDRVGVSWYDGSLSPNPKRWQDQFADDLDRQDLQDAAERQADEIALLPKLEKLNAKAEAIRAEAQALIEALPTPKAAKMRSERTHWEHASYPLQAKFPLLFK